MEQGSLVGGVLCDEVGRLVRLGCADSLVVRVGSDANEPNRIDRAIGEEVGQKDSLTGFIGKITTGRVLSKKSKLPRALVCLYLPWTILAVL